MPDMHRVPLRCPCEGAFFSTHFIYHEPPEGEIRFQFSTGDAYYREIRKCGVCNHFISVHEMDTSRLYSEDYVSSNYGDSGILRTFNKINSLPPEKSDNVGRVNRVLVYAASHFDQYSSGKKPHSVLDVGSGLCVFLFRMKEAGWQCTAVDPDPRSIKHAQEVVEVEAICGDFMSVEMAERYDVITFNKVLEHVEDPVAMLAKSRNHLNPGGFVYVELPDGEAAAAAGANREEFYVDHLHVFSLQSVAFLAERAGFKVNLVERLREPSTKYTLRAFMVPSSTEQRLSEESK